VNSPWRARAWVLWRIKSAGLLLLGSAALLGGLNPEAAHLRGRTFGLSDQLSSREKVIRPGSSVQPQGQSTRAVTVADVIRMTRIGGTGDAKYHFGASLTEDFAVFSPDRRYFVVVVNRGNLERNTNEYSMLLFESAKAFDRVYPRTLVSFASSSDREGIKDAVWLNDSHTLMFLGERSGEMTQIHTVDSRSGRIGTVTNEKASIESYSTTPTGDCVAYTINRPPRPLVGQSAALPGLHVTNELLTDLIAGEVHADQPDLMMKRAGWHSARKLTTSGKLPLQFGQQDFFISPDARYLVVPTDPMTIPRGWGRYRDAAIQTIIARNIPDGSRTLLYRYELVDLMNRKSRVLLDSPIAYSGSEVSWAPDSHSVLLTGVYLPLNVQDLAEQTVRESRRFVVEVKVPSLEFSTITSRDSQLVGWDTTTQFVGLKSREINQDGSVPRIEYYQKRSSGWSRLEATPEAVNTSTLEIGVAQDLNNAPRIVAEDSRTSRSAVLIDLNPQFKQLWFGRVEEVRWVGGGTHEFVGGLFLPPNYIPGTRYPLVIQTHGFDPPGSPHSFWIDGPFSTAFAAQPLAAKGIVVLQVPDPGPKGTPLEAPLMMETFEQAVDYLGKKGIIDTHRVGIIGFSRTCLYVKYTLTHSRYHFAAAVVADGMDAGYWQYMAYANTSPSVAAEFDALVGAPPFGEGLRKWLDYSPGFLLDRVRSPLLIQGIGPSSLLSEWQWFSGLKRLGKAVDLVYLPTGMHVLRKPRDRMVSLQSVVDWFCFWLKGEEDPDPAKVLQYKHWFSLGRPETSDIAH
jgi:Prolyl oligopeptidase family